MLWFTQIFKDNNDYNEKTIIGFISFAIMVLTAILDLLCGVMEIDLTVKEYIYQSFVTVTLGSFGVAGVERFSAAARVESEAAVRTSPYQENEDHNMEPDVGGIPCPNCGYMME